MLEGFLLDIRRNIVLRISHGEEVFIGRDCSTDDGHLYIDDVCISRQHGIIKCQGEFYYKDCSSKNGSFINGEGLMPEKWTVLTDGDYIRLGKNEFQFRIAVSKKNTGTGERKTQGFSYYINNSLGGRKLQINLKKRGCVEYQLRMIEENPNLSIARTMHVCGIENDSIMCELDNYIALKDYMSNYPFDSAMEFLERIIRAVKLGEEYMLDKDNYLIEEDALFINTDGEIRLIYLPCGDLAKKRFYEGLSGLCEYIVNEKRADDEGKLKRIGELIGEKEHSPEECLKIIYNFKEIEIPEKKKEDKKKYRLNKKHIFTAASFILFMTVFWMDLMSLTHLGAVALIIIGINILIYGLSPGKKTNNVVKKPFAKSKSISVS